MAEFQALLRAKAEWKPHQIAKAGDIGALAEAAKSLAEVVKETLSLASIAMEIVKLLALLQSINPLLIVLEALADEVLKQIHDIKEAGFWYLYVDPYFIKNVNPMPAFTYGFEQLRNNSGERLWLSQDRFGNFVETNIIPSDANIKAGQTIPFLATPRKLVPGGYNPHAGASNDPLASISPYPKFTSKQVIKEMVKAFEDEGDVPRFKAVAGSPKSETVVYDNDGNSYSGWERTKEFGLQLYDIGKDSEDGSVIKDYKASRLPVNTKIAPGKPNILGSTLYDGGSGAIAIVIGAPSFDIFAETFNKFSKMFTDIPEFAGAAGMSIADSFNEMVTPANTIIKLTQCDSNYDLFTVGDTIGGDIYGGILEITEINADSVIASSMSTLKETTITDDVGNTRAVTVVVNPNEDERWMDMEITGKPYRTVDGLNPFITGDIVYQMEVRGTAGVGGEKNWVNVGQSTVTLPKKQRIYPKVGKVAMEKLAVLPDSTPPDFGGIQIKDIIPGWGEFFQILENFVKQLKGMIADSAVFIQDMIDMIKGIEAFLEELIKIILDFLKFFQVTLPSTGVYALYIPNQPDGNDGLKSTLSGATGVPDLAYAAGILFVGTEAEALIAGGGSKNPIDLLALVLGLL